MESTNFVLSVDVRFNWLNSRWYIISKHLQTHGYIHCGGGDDSDNNDSNDDDDEKYDNNSNDIDGENDNGYDGNNDNGSNDNVDNYTATAITTKI